RDLRRSRERPDHPAHAARVRRLDHPDRQRTGRRAGTLRIVGYTVRHVASSVASGKLAAMYDVLIVGGGPAGSAAAIGLATAGHRVAVVERDQRRRPRACGELLTPRAARAVAALGPDPATLGYPIESVRLSRVDPDGRRHSATTPWPASDRGFV